MAIDLHNGYAELIEHEGHDVVCVTYGTAHNVALECQTCGVVLLDFDKPRPRWSVRIGGYPNGWEAPVLETDDPETAISKFETVNARLRGGGYRYYTVAIFDDNGEGEPLGPDRVRELVDEASG